MRGTYSDIDERTAARPNVGGLKGTGPPCCWPKPIPFRWADVRGGPKLLGAAAGFIHQ